MTLLSALSDLQALGALNEAVGCEPSSVEGIAELLRAEVSAQGSCTRSATIRRVCRYAEPAVTLDEESVADVCDRLEREGDLVLASGGLLFATPLRAVDLTGGTFRVASSLPTRRLRSVLAGTWDVSGTSRAWRVTSAEEARAAVHAAGGAVLSPEGWAGLDRVPPADENWLAALDRRLGAAPEAPSSLERDGALPWQGCVAGPNGVQWKGGAEADDARLWRARNQWGRWLYAWTHQGTPAVAPFVSLRPDEGTRSFFAVAQGLGLPCEVSLERSEAEGVLRVSHWLPVAEYRYLAISASSSAVEKSGHRWAIPADRLPRVLGELEKRLGLVVGEEARP